MAGVSENNVSDEKLTTATGRPRAQWNELLDGADASTWKHPQIARWLVEEHGVDGWWAQNITVAYEQARGMRLPGQLADGTFSASSSKSFDGTQAVLLEEVVDAYSRFSGEQPTSVRPTAKHPTARWKLADGSGVLATVSPGGGGKSRVTLTYLRLPTADQLERAKLTLAEVLGTVRSRVDKSVD
jgi:hypothetical protein